MKKYTLGIIIVSMFMISLPASASTVDEIMAKLIKVQEQLNEMKSNSLGGAAIAGTKDLTISSVLTISPNPTAPKSKNTFTGTATVNEAFTKDTKVIADIQVKKDGKLYLDTPINVVFKKNMKTASFSSSNLFSSEKYGTEFEIGFCIDNYNMPKNGKIPEFNEDNNCSPSWTKVTLGQVLPTPNATKDLTISKVTSVSPNPTAPNVKNTFKGTATINQAFTKTTTVRADIQIKKDGKVYISAPIDIKFAKNSKTASFSTYYTFKNEKYGSEFEIGFCIDKYGMPSNGNIAEFNEDNNCSPELVKIVLGQVVATPTSAKDLTVSKVTSISPNPAVVGTKNTFTATASVNEAFTVDTKVVGDIQIRKDGKIYYDSPIDVLFKKGSKTALISIWDKFVNEKSGTSLEVGFCVDKYQMSSNGKIAESNEDNNCSPEYVPLKIK